MNNITHTASFLQIHLVSLLHGSHVIILLLKSSHQLIHLQSFQIK